MSHECSEACVPAGLRAVRPDGEKVPVTAELQEERLKNGDYELLVKVPDGPIDHFEHDGSMLPGHAISFVSSDVVREQERRTELEQEEGGPESGPETDEEQDEH